MTPHTRFTEIRAALARLEDLEGHPREQKALEQAILEHLKVLEREGILALLEPWTLPRPAPDGKPPRKKM